MASNRESSFAIQMPIQNRRPMTSRNVNNQRPIATMVSARMYSPKVARLSQKFFRHNVSTVNHLTINSDDHSLL